jgi:alanine racemase
VVERTGREPVEPGGSRAAEDPGDDTSRLAGSRVTIDLGALVDNWRSVSRTAQAAETSAVVKADAYGLGLDRIGATLTAAGCRTFFVATPTEGITLRRAVGPPAAIYVLDGLLPGAAREYIQADIRPVIGSVDELREWAEAGTRTTGAAIHVDTGMNRLGLTPAEAAEIAQDRNLVTAAGPALLMSHLACADTPSHPLSAAQLRNFRELRSLFPALPASLANSAGIFLHGDYHFDLVRPGIALYGARFAENRPPLQTVVTLEARVLQVRAAAAQQTVGYGAAETVRGPARIAVLGMGYADGYIRAASSSDARPGARAFVRGQFSPLIGRVSMDLLALDVTGIPDVRRGDWVELFGANVAVDEVAERAGTIGYELLTALGTRHDRRYLG